MAQATVVTSSTLQELVQLKENEWKEAQELRNNSLQAALQHKDRQLNNEKLRFRKLKEDFEYNLKLLEERDQELERYDAQFSQFRNVNSLRDGEISDLKIRLDEVNLKLSHEEKAREELQRHYQQRLREHQQELNQFRLQKDSEVKKEREEFESFKRQLQTQLRAAEEDVETQKQELMAGFDDSLRKREHEFRKKTDEMSNSLLASELKVKLLAKELELLRASGDRAKDELETTESVVHDLEKQLKQKEWEASDKQNMNSAKVAELEAQIEQLKTTATKAEARFHHKHAELDRHAKEKEQALISAKQLHIEQERSLEEKIRLLQNQLETEQVECRRLQWAHKDAVKEKDLELQKLQGIIIELKIKLDKQIGESARSTVARDLELEALKQQEGKMKMEISQYKENIERYKKELTMAMERESSQERSKAQIEVDWQRRCEDTEREVYNKQEQLITGLTKARDEARALAQERERELIQQDNLIQVLTYTKDQAVMTLQRHGLSVPTELPSKENRIKLSSLDKGVDNIQDLTPVEKSNILQQQNTNLREVIRQMRHDMEDLSNELASRPPSVMVQGRDSQEGTSVPLTAEYVESLEREIKQLKSTNRSLTQQIDELSQSSKPPLLVNRPVSNQSQDIFIQAHIKELNGTIGALRQEKLELSAHLKKHQATADHLQGVLNQAHEEVRQKQLAIDQLQYELTALGRRSADQHSALQQRVTDLELQLTQTRTEADEYFKSGLERNAEATSLGNQLSTLKVELASQGRGAPSFNPQATIVTQLQEEIRRLRKQLTSAGMTAVGKHSVDPVFSARPEAVDVARLRMKLQAAVRRIGSLAQEKEQLIQMGNRLRAELTRYTVGRGSAPPGPVLLESTEPHLIQPLSRKPATSKTPGEIKEHFRGQLNAVEKLQYQLTSQELQFAQRMAQQKAADQVKVTVLSSSSESNGGEKASELSSVARDTDNKKSDAKDEHVTHQSTNQWTSSPPDGQPFFTSSSEGQASLQEIWKMLDEEDSFRSPTPQRFHPNSPGEPKTSNVLVPDHIPTRDPPERDVFALKGKRTGIDKKSATLQRPILPKKAAGKAKSTPKKLRVRNYNIKDDT